MKRSYTAELYCHKGDVERIEVLANPDQLEQVAIWLLSSRRRSAGVRFLREADRHQVVEVLHYRRKDGMIRAVWREESIKSPAGKL